MANKRLIVIVGPTAVGKTELAVRLGERLGAEILSADSRQVYKELNIGTAKPSAEQLSRVKHHFIGSHSIRDDYGAGQFGREALSVIEQLFASSDNVILCGGSGLYVKAVCEGLDDMPEISNSIRREIIEKYERNGLPWLQQQVATKDPAYFEVVDTKNPHRLIRALELLTVHGTSVTTLRKKSQKSHPFQITKIGLELSRDELYQRIDVRMDHMIDAGLFAEAESFFGDRHANALQTVGYREIFGYLEGTYDQHEALRLLKRNSRRYAKRQMTWFKKDADIVWFDATDMDKVSEKIFQMLDEA